MLCFPFLLFGLIRLQTTDSEILRVQITVPEKIQPLSREGVQSNVSYNIVIDGQTYTMNLMQKAFLPHNFRVYGYNGTGHMKPFEQEIQNFCYYQGYIEGYPDSMVILSTCTGLRGLLQFENVSYGIEPLEPSFGFEHVIYQVQHKNEGASLYAEDIKPREMPYKIQSIEPLTEFSQYIEMHVVVEKNLYHQMGSDTAIVTQKIFQLISLTNAIFTSFNIAIILSSLELWIDENKIPVTGDANQLLHRFLRWKKSYLVLRPHDMAFLLVYREKANYIGATFQGKMCDRQYGGSVALHPKTISMESFSVIIAQLLSLSMGIAYDDLDKCQCPGAVCIMNPEAIHSSGVKFFSNCSMEDFAHFISKPKAQCLQNHPRLDPTYKTAVCGNSIVEEGEACDCGTQEFKPKGELCRSSDDECDLPEYCNGSSASCQDNFYIQDGHPCGDSQWLCIHGNCMSMDKQCKDVFGEDISGAPQECFEYLNAMADTSGNCGISDSGYKKCESKDLQCGKLICKYEQENVLFMTSATITYTNIKGQICISLEYPTGDANSAKMWVKDGTVCGQNQVCNNEKNCHCNPGYLPPNCNTEQDSWPGGSINSGNFPPTGSRSPERLYIENAYPSRPMRWPFFLLIPFAIILSVMITTLVKVYLQRKKWKTEEYTSDEYINFIFKIH
ncbi:disintegrin and metalloproteinase domain-containing protein 2 [Glossophaga mutica]